MGLKILVVTVGLIGIFAVSYVHHNSFRVRPGGQLEPVLSRKAAEAMVCVIIAIVVLVVFA